jgi:hypothetical protein
MTAFQNFVLIMKGNESSLSLTELVNSNLFMQTRECLLINLV